MQRCLSLFVACLTTLTAALAADVVQDGQSVWQSRYWGFYMGNGYRVITNTVGSEQHIEYADKVTGEFFITAFRRGYYNPVCVISPQWSTNLWRRVTIDNRLILHLPRTGTNAPSFTITRGPTDLPFYPMTGWLTNGTVVHVAGKYRATVPLENGKWNHVQIGLWEIVP